MKLKRLLFCFCAAVPLLTVLRIVEQGLMIDPKNGFYYDKYPWGGMLLLVILAVMLLLVILGRTCRRYPMSAPSASRPVFIVSAVMAAAFAVDIFQTVLSQEFSVSVLGESRGVLFYLHLLYIAMAAMSLLFFAYYAFVQYSGRRASRLAPVIPVITFVLKLAVVFTEHSDIANISDNVNNILMLSFLLVFWLLHGRMVSDSGYARAVKWAYGVGFAASLYCVICTLPYYLLTVFGKSGLLHQTELPSVVLLASAVYIPVFLCAAASGKTARPSELERMELEQAAQMEDAPHADAEREEPMSRADKIYEELISEQRDIQE